MKHIIITILFMIIPCVATSAGSTIELKNENDKINYSVGYQIGVDFKRQGVNINSPALVKGIQDALKTNKPVISEQEMQTTLVNLKNKIITKEQEKINNLANSTVQKEMPFWLKMLKKKA